MKLKGAKQVHYDSGPNMTPLVDVVMVILIFLMLAGTFTSAEHYLISDQAIQSGVASDAPPPAGFIPDEPLDIRVDCPTPDKFVATAGQIRVSDGASLKAQLTKMREDFQAADTPPERIQVKINPGRNVKYQFLIQVYEAALDAGFKKVAFTTAH